MKVLPQPEGKDGGTCLAVGEDGAVVALEHVVHEAEGGLLVDDLLGGLRAEHIVESKTFRLVLLVGLEDGHLLVLLVHLDDSHTVCLSQSLLRYFSLVLIGLQRTITFTDSAIQ